MKPSNVRQINHMFGGVFGSDRLIYKHGFAFIFDRICDLTSIVSPTIRRVGEEFKIDYELGLVVIDDTLRGVDALEKQIELNRHVILPMVLPAENTLDLVTIDNNLQRWLIDRLYSDLAKYCLRADEAIALIDEGRDGFFRKLQRVYGAGFDSLISRPLREMC